MSEKEGTLRMMPSGQWAVCRPGETPHEITSGALFHIEFAGKLHLTRMNLSLFGEAVMLDWLTWPANLLLSIGGWAVSCFISRDATNFDVVQMMFATLVLAAFVALIAYRQTLFEYWRSLWKSRE